MRLLMICGCAMLTSCAGFVAAGGSLQTAGEGYRDAIDAAYLACNYSGSEREAQPGDGYRESKDAAEDADCHGDK